ncbi:MAG TPA: hypothetical protein VFJ76_08835 [Solirubrobacterales bacterium]|nr:hypothetical protein [Solirubrobacterales bacterium]
MSSAYEIEPEPPAVPEALLGSGTIGAFRWAVSVGRESESASPGRPCVKLATGEGTLAEYESTVRACVSLSTTPNVLGVSSGQGEATRTVFGMAFPKRVRSVRIWLDGRGSRRIPLALLAPDQAAATGLSRFRFAAGAIEGPFCLRRSGTYDASGNLLKLSPRMACSWGYTHEQ